MMTVVSLDFPFFAFILSSSDNPTYTRYAKKGLRLLRAKAAENFYFYHSKQRDNQQKFLFRSFQVVEVEF